jgi:HlyD family secretion protein
MQSALDVLHQAEQLQAQLTAAIAATASSAASAVASAVHSVTTRPSAAASSSASSGGATTPQQSSFGGQGTQSTASRITTDTAAVQADEVALGQAQDALAATTLTSPVTGVVSALPFSVGGRASAGQSVSITTKGAADVTINVASSSIRSVKVGQVAHVTADGAVSAVEGRVSAIGLLPSSSSSSSTTTYPVTVHVPDPGSGFVDGSQAQVSVVLASVKDAIVVPNSALHDGIVDVLQGTTVKRVRVETGAVGAVVTQVTSGVTAGELVVLADLSQAVPTSSTSLSSLQRSTSGGRQFRFGGGAGGFTPPAGFTANR